jgi:hypothetical protein
VIGSRRFSRSTGTGALPPRWTLPSNSVAFLHRDNLLDAGVLDGAQLHACDGARVQLAACLE